ncbi:MAG: iron ABC transporter permease [Actinomycetota bacterium]|nr:MAG: iron ABC transporter permease [Actinomycetota bacterium]
MRRRGGGRWLYLAAVGVAAVGLLPIAFIVGETLSLGGTQIASSILRERVGALLVNTVTLTAVTTLCCSLVGLGAAWLVERTDVPARRLWAALLVAPLAVPAFVTSYAWASLQPGFEGLPAAALITTLAYFPFVYLPAAAAIRGLDPGLEEAAAALGFGPVRVFLRVTLPQLRLALLGGALLVALHVLAEFGALQMIGYETFTVAILTQYQSSFNGSAATMLAGVSVILCLGLLLLEALLRGRARYSRIGSGAARVERTVALRAWRWPVTAVVAAVLIAAIGVPGVAVSRWLSYGADVADELLPALRTSLELGIAGAVVATLVGLPLAWLAVRHRSALTAILERCTYVSSALPGVVVALALVTVCARWFDALYQTIALLIVGYVILFLPRAIVSLRPAIAQARPEFDDAARSLGASHLRRVGRIALPLLSPGLASAAAFVFVAVITELTATLLLAPAGVNTLATRFWSYSDELDYAAAAPFAAAMVLLSVPFTYLILQQSRRMRRR